MVASFAAARPTFSLPEKHVVPSAQGQSLWVDYRLENDIINKDQRPAAEHNL